MLVAKKTPNGSGNAQTLSKPTEKSATLEQESKPGSNKRFRVSLLRHFLAEQTEG